MENIVFEFTHGMRIEYLEGHRPTSEQLEWLKELALADYLAMPLSERIARLEANAVEQAWKEKEIQDFLDSLNECAKLDADIVAYEQACIQEEMESEISAGTGDSTNLEN